MLSRMCKSSPAVTLGSIGERPLIRAVSQTINSRTVKQGPQWYNTVSSKERLSRGDLQNLKYLFTLVSNVKNDVTMDKDVTEGFSRIRQRLQAMEFFPFLSLMLIKKSGLLDDKGLPLIFENRARGVRFPSDIRADADILFRKWMSGQIDPHLLRGIMTKAGTGKGEKVRKSHGMEKDFAGRVSCNYVGAGNLVNGQWWALQLCAIRDGAHGEVEAGIHGQACHSRSMDGALTDSLNRKATALTRLSLAEEAMRMLTTATLSNTVAHKAPRIHPRRGLDLC